jgi:regulator of sigma E protease
VSIIIFIIILAVLIIVHEYGHFIVAKKGGIRVDEFGLGYPPRAKKLFHRKGTDFTLNWLPFGGFVKIFGENPDDESLNGSNKNQAFVNKPKWIQALVLFAGPFMNFLFAWAIILVALFIGLPTTIDSSMQTRFVQNESTIITDVAPDSPAHMAGLMAGDVINSVSVKGKIYPDINTRDLHNLVIANPTSNFSISYTRVHELKDVSITPQKDEGSGEILLGIGIDNYGVYKPDFVHAILDSFKFAGAMIVNIAVSLWTLIKGIFVGGADLSNLSGPIGIVSLVGNASKMGLVYLLSFTALISVNLGIINLIPFPALDGGRLLFLAIEKIKGGRVNYKILNILNLVGFALLIILMLFISYRDIIKLVHS